MAGVQGVAGLKLKQLSDRNARIEQSLTVRARSCIICCNLITNVYGFSVPIEFQVPLSNLTGAVSHSSTTVIKSEALKKTYYTYKYLSTYISTHTHTHTARLYFNKLWLLKVLITTTLLQVL
jgi:hypothetical protein